MTARRSVANVCSVAPVQLVIRRQWLRMRVHLRAALLMFRHHRLLICCYLHHPVTQRLNLNLTLYTSATVGGRYCFHCRFCLFVATVVNNTLWFKKRPHHPCDCGFYDCWPISIIFGTQCTELICNITVTDLPTSPTYCCYTTFGNKSSA